MGKQKPILLGKGLKVILFGSTKLQVKQIFGEPDQVNTFDNDISDMGESHVWNYNKAGISFTFEEVDDFRLSNISVINDNYLLRNLISIGMSKEHVLDALDELNMTDYAQEDHSDQDNPNHSLVAIDEKSLYLWFDDDVLTEIQWFPYFSEDEEIIWPKN